VRSPGSRGALSTLFLFYLVAFAAFVVWAVASLPDLFPVFKWPYIWTAAFVRFVDYAIPVTVAGLAVAYSLFLRSGGEPRRPFHRVVGSQLATLVALTVLYTAALYGFYPRSRALLVELEELTGHGRSLLEQARREQEAGRLEEARKAYERYLNINRRDQEVEGELDQLKLAIGAPRKEQSAERKPAAGEPVRAQSPEQYLAVARSHFDREEWFSAVYFADLAVRVSGERSDAVSQAARRLSAQAWERIRSVNPEKDIQDTKLRALFRSKQDGYGLFSREDYLGAYYHFLELSRRHPQDQDVRRFLEDSREWVRQMHYFPDEAERLTAQPGLQELLFVNPRDDDAREIVSIGKMVSAGGQTFFKDIEVLRFAAGRLLLHYTAPYGRLEQAEAPPAGQSPGPRAVILLHGVDPERPGRDLLPRLITGSLRGEEPRNVLRLAPRPGELAALRAPGTANRSHLGSVGLDTLWLARAGIGVYGQMESALSLEILMRLLLPFAFLNLGLLAMALGWSYRLTPNGRPPAAAYLVIPLFPVAAALLAGVYLKVHRVLAAFTLLTWGFRPALVGLAVLEGAILAVMLVLLAGRGGD
jgi:tetratricopeptide (TPR) repeat protein